MKLFVPHYILSLILAPSRGRHEPTCAFRVTGAHLLTDTSNIGQRLRQTNRRLHADGRIQPEISLHLIEAVDRV